MKKKLIPVALTLAVALGGFLLHTLKKDESNILEVYGNVDQRQIELAFLDSERIKDVLVEEGAVVEKGQVMARLETARLEDAMNVAKANVEQAEAVLRRLENGTRPEEIDQARATVQSAKAELSFAVLQKERIEKIWNSSTGKGVRKQELDEAERRLDVARASLEQAQKSLKLAEIGPRIEVVDEAKASLKSKRLTLAQLQTKLDDAELKSPSKATVSRRLLEPGDMAMPQRAVFSLAVLSPKWVRAYVSEKDLGYIEEGLPAKVFIDSHPDNPVEGRLSFISPVSEFTPKTVQTPELRTSLVYEIRVQVDDKKNILRLGMPVTVRIDAKKDSRP